MKLLTEVVYSLQLIKKEYCPTISAYRTHKVAKQKPVPVIVYDYYDSSRRARAFYEPRSATICDICGEGEDCSKVCSIEKKTVSGNQRGDPTTGSSRKSSATSETPNLLTLLTIFICVLFTKG